ncbi:MAG: hypothetical protein EPN23_06735 [Verrucomicrobia bacterium]|nr:MAG: hypothetical protein EPN23_06735 [Verrucomicrobiota bacterium]
MKKSASWIMLVTSLGVSAWFFAGCGGGGDGAGGQATVTGSLKSFPSSDAKQIAQNAKANQGGVEVEIVGTDIRGTTADDGLFVLAGVPGGHHNVRFSRGTHQAALGVDVPTNGIVHLDGVHVSDADDISVEAHHTEIFDDHGNDGTNEVEHVGGNDDSYNGGTNEVEHAGGHT